ncbi:hypothetical protein FRC09_005868, partial [Ceratobasidium sp. 395]
SGSSNQAQRAPTQPNNSRQAVRRQQTTPSAFLKIPADILAQIVPRLSPTDVVNLARVNTSVRKVLMHRSANSMWRACIEKAGLPACPPEISEPKYVSVLCLLVCSACGAGENRKPDAYLLVRLCARCRRDKLVDWEAVRPEELQPLVMSSGGSRFKSEPSTLKHCLKQEVEKARARLDDLRSSGDERAVQAWLESQKAMLQTRNEVKRGDLITQWFEKTRQDKLRAVRDTWRKQVESRLTALGYSLPDQDFPREKKERYESFFKRVDEFDEFKWNSLKPRIIQLLETETKERPERQRKERRVKREFKLRELLYQLLGQLAVGIPENFDELSVIQQTTLLASWLPLPKPSEVQKWTMFDGWVDSEISVEAIQERFNAHREEVTQSALDQGKRIIQGLAAIIREGREEHGLTVDHAQDSPPVTGGEGHIAGKVDADITLLLRADSFFAYKAYKDFSGVQTYSGIVQSRLLRDDLDPASFKFHSEASSIARTLLMSLGRPNASSLEFTDDCFTCGRCYAYKMDLYVAVRHYMEMSELRKSVEPSLPAFSRLGIAYNNMHDFNFQTSRPLLVQLSPQEVTDLTTKFERLDKMLSWNEQAAEELEVPMPGNNATTGASGSEGAIGNQGEGEDTGEVEGENVDEDEGEDEDEDEEDDEPELWQRDRFACKLCEQAQLKFDLHNFRFIPHMFAHLRNVHDISDPERGLDVTDRESINNSPYLRLAGKFEGLTWGWTMTMGRGHAH